MKKEEKKIENFANLNFEGVPSRFYCISISYRYYGDPLSGADRLCEFACALIPLMEFVAGIKSAN